MNPESLTEVIRVKLDNFSTTGLKSELQLQQVGEACRATGRIYFLLSVIKSIIFNSHCQRETLDNWYLAEGSFRPD